MNLRVSILSTAYALLLAAGRGEAQRREQPLQNLIPGDLAYAMRDTAAGWVMYQSGGSARGDTARRLAAAGVWDLEGSDGKRGIRLLQAAFRFGVADSSFYHDAFELFKLLRCPAEASALVDEVRRRWPADRWADSASRRALQGLQHASDDDRKRVCPLRVRSENAQ